MDNKNIILLTALGAGVLYMMNQQQQEQQQTQSPAQQPYAPQNSYAYQPAQQQTDYLDRINNTVSKVTDAVNAGKSIFDDVRSLFKKPPSFTPVQTPPSLPPTSGYWA